MPSLQIRDMPEELYESLSERARRERRSLAQQAVSDLSLIEELERAQGRRAAIDSIRDCQDLELDVDPVSVIREDRER